MEPAQTKHDTTIDVQYLYHVFYSSWLEYRMKLSRISVRNGAAPFFLFLAA
jgi:hypothetical protein